MAKGPSWGKMIHLGQVSLTMDQAAPKKPSFWGMTTSGHPGHPHARGIKMDSRIAWEVEAEVPWAPHSLQEHCGHFLND